MRDNIYKKISTVTDFEFNHKVANVFDDMIERSVPCYKQMNAMIGLYSKIYPKNNSNIYDLGCSTGNATLSVISNLKINSFKIFSVDSSAEMIKKSRQKNKAFSSNIEFIQADINELQIKKASLVILSLTLQFIPIKKRLKLIRKIYDSLLPGGAFILNEKIVDKRKTINKQLIEIHESFKRENGYSETEIARKRQAIEKVLLPESIEQHLKRLRDVGFKAPLVQMQCINFASFLAVK